MPGVVGSGGKKKAVSKSHFRRERKKAQRAENATADASKPTTDGDSTTKDASTANGVSTNEGVDNTATAPAPIPLNSLDEGADEFDFDDPLYEQFKDVFSKFQEPTAEEAAKAADKPTVFYDEDDIPDEEDEEETKKTLSKRARKERDKLSIAELKALVKKPELVEWTDVSSSDPRLLISIKGHKNVVPVPAHWSLKREYLSSKRGIEKPAYALPKFIAETGISEMRDAVLEKMAEQTLKQKARERVQGKLGKLDIDYQKLYEAFFRRQTKPEITRFGEVYYEGKEYETNLKHLRPGELSDELKEALSMPPGAPPPWLINQQRYGPPPSYPNLKIPGLNAPPPPGSSWGFAPGQYGKPPVDEFGRPQWGGDVTNPVVEQQPQSTQVGEPVERATWGLLRAEGESEDEESEAEEEGESDEEEEGGVDISGVETSMTGLSSILPSEYGGTESITGEFTLRKNRKGTETEEPAGPRSAYQVLPEQNIRASGFFGGERAYDLKAARQDRIGEDNSRKRKAGAVDVSVDVDALARDDRLNKEELGKAYEAQKQAEAKGNWSAIDQDDLSEMIATESRKRMKKDNDRHSRR